MISQVEIPEAKILRPSMAEFIDFETFVESPDNEKALETYGMVKVIPPAKWKPRNGDAEPKLEEIIVSSPIEQNVQGRSGIYELLLIQKKSMKLNEYRKKVQFFDRLTDNKSSEEVEDLFWKNIVFSPPLYGADISGRTLFDSGLPWNLNELPGVSKEGLKSPISGVTNTYLYIGSWKSMFGWHKEDMDLYSINYNHYGKPKFWYCMPVSEAKKLEDYARIYFDEGFSKCKEFLRHKTIMIHPYLLKQKIPSLKIYKMVQNPGEFIITGGGAYHAGFNWGFNVAEAVNFATVKWLEMLPSADACQCVNDSVRINKTEFYKNIMGEPKYANLPEIKKICTEQGVSKRESAGRTTDKRATIRNSEQKEPLRRSLRRSSIKIGEDIKEKLKETEKGINQVTIVRERAYTRKKSQKNNKKKHRNKESTSHLALRSKKIIKPEINKMVENKKVTRGTRKRSEELANKKTEIDILQKDSEQKTEVSSDTNSVNIVNISNINNNEQTQNSLNVQNILNETIAEPTFPVLQETQPRDDKLLDDNFKENEDNLPVKNEVSAAKGMDIECE